MAISNKMTDLLNKIERRLGLIPLTPHLPENLNKAAWAKVIEEDTLVTFSRYFYHKIRFLVNDETTYNKIENGVKVYYIKDEYLQGMKLLGVEDIDWQDFSGDNIALAQTGGYGYYTPNYIGCPVCTYETMMGYQMMADMQSLYNQGIYVDFEYPNKLILSGIGGTVINIKKFVVNLLVQHPNLNTISPTKMETFEALAQADVANFLQKNLRYVDGLETVYVNIDLKLSELESEAGKRDNIIDDIKNSYVSASNDNIPYILTV
jgi:hypothetical protein